MIRHGQASFGADDYDRLSDTGVKQSELAGDYLRHIGWVPDRVLCGTLKRQRDTLAGMGFAPDAEHAGLNEYDFHNLLEVRFGSSDLGSVITDRKTHFRALRETLLDWQGGGLTGAGESWQDFCDRIDAARQSACAPGAERVLVASSGGAIARLVSAALGTDGASMIALNLQIKNAALTRFIFTQRPFFLHSFNETPHLDGPDVQHWMTYS